MRFDVITLFPELVEQVVGCGVVQRAQRAGLFQLRTWNPRDYTQDVHRTVDDRPYGGGPGMLILYQPLLDALNAARGERENDAVKVIYLSPQGSVLSQVAVNHFANSDQDLILIAGRYEGIDERFVEAHVDEEWSIGDYVLSGGELPIMTLIDAVVRQIPGALGHSESAQQDSFMEGLLDCPQYTRPEKIDGLMVPEILLSGNHAKIAEWRHQQSLERTRVRRPDLFEQIRVKDK